MTISLYTQAKQVRREKQTLFRNVLMLFYDLPVDLSTIRNEATISDNGLYPQKLQCVWEPGSSG